MGNVSLLSFLFWLILLSTKYNHIILATPPSVRTCEPITLGSCKKLGYNSTGMPNLAGHETQNEAEQSFLTFEPLIKFGCSSQLRFFLCSVYAPLCTEKVSDPIGPCRQLCETVRHRCLPVLVEFDFMWPAHLNCSLFPAENNHQTMCMEGPGEEELETWENSRKIKPILGFKTSKDSTSERNGRPNQLEIYPPPPSIIYSSPVNNHSRPFNSMPQNCTALKFHQQYYVVKNGPNDGHCAHGCSADILYLSKTKQFADFWIAFWATFCLASSFYTIYVFYCHSSDFVYPERTIIYMGISYSIFSLTHLISFAIGRNEIACYENRQYHVSLLIQKGFVNGYCVLVFVLLYLTEMSSLLWWFIHTITWYLAVGQQWTADRLQSIYCLYHSIAWGIPLILTTIILIRGDIDADELTGKCNVGNHNQEALFFFIIIPTLITLILGIIILLNAITVYFIRRPRKIYQPSPCLVQLNSSSYQSSSEKISYNNLSSQNSQPQLIPHSASWHKQPNIRDELGSSMIRQGIFILIYFAIASYLVFVSFYEYFYRNSWYSASVNDLPNVEIMSLKIFMPFLVGIMTGVWVWMSKPTLPFSLTKNWTKKKPLPPGLSIPHHNIVSLPATSLGTLDSRERFINRGGETSL